MTMSAPRVDRVSRLEQIAIAAAVAFIVALLVAYGFVALGGGAGGGGNQTQANQTQLNWTTINLSAWAPDNIVWRLEDRGGYVRGEVLYIEWSGGTPLIEVNIMLVNATSGAQFPVTTYDVVIFDKTGAELYRFRYSIPYAEYVKGFAHIVFTAPVEEGRAVIIARYVHPEWAVDAKVVARVYYEEAYPQP